MQRRDKTNYYLDLAEVVIRDDKFSYRIIDVNEWIENDDSLDGKRGY